MARIPDGRRRENTTASMYAERAKGKARGLTDYGKMGKTMVLP